MANKNKRKSISNEDDDDDDTDLRIYNAVKKVKFQVTTEKSNTDDLLHGKQTLIRFSFYVNL